MSGEDHVIATGSPLTLAASSLRGVPRYCVPFAAEAAEVAGPLDFEKANAIALDPREVLAHGHEHPAASLERALRRAGTGVVRGGRGDALGRGRPGSCVREGRRLHCVALRRGAGSLRGHVVGIRQSRTGRRCRERGRWQTTGNPHVCGTPERGLLRAGFNFNNEC